MAVNLEMKQLKPRILILVEGEKTEIKYINSFKKHDKFRRMLETVKTEVYKPKDHSPRGLVNEAKRRVKNSKKDKYPYKEIWLVFDKDGHKQIPDTFNDVHEHNNNQNNKKIKTFIEIAFSNICFEYWILLHFEKTSKPFNRCDENKNHEPNVIAYIQKNHDPNYNKSDYNFLPLLEKVSTAVENAKWLEKQNEKIEEKLYNKNPYTDVHKLTEKIIKGFTNE